MLKSIPVFSIDLNQAAESQAGQIVEKVKKIILNPGLNDFEVVEEIICVLEDNNVNTGYRHDFG